MLFVEKVKGMLSVGVYNNAILENIKCFANESFKAAISGGSSGGEIYCTTFCGGYAKLSGAVLAITTNENPYLCCSEVYAVSSAKGIIAIFQKSFIKLMMHKGYHLVLIIIR